MDQRTELIKPMLRISEIGKWNGAVTLHVEGRLIGPWVPEMRAACEAAQREHELQLDLGDLEFVDDSGIRLLLGLLGQGVALDSAPPFIREQLRIARGEKSST
jgi:anti-anti-sigma regulatory factor